MGLQQVDGEWLPRMSDAVGTASPSKKTFASQRFRTLLEDHHQAAANTYHDVGDTFWHESGSTTRIDYVAIPRALLEADGTTCRML